MNELVRWLLYADLGVLFGVPAVATLLGVGERMGGLRKLLLFAAVAGVPISLTGFLLTLSVMAGTDVSGLDHQLVADLATRTAMGWAFMARLLALGAAVMAIASKRKPSGWTTLPAAIAVGSLAWSGHAAAGEGSLGYVQLGGDILHLLAASAWIGALVLFLGLLSGRFSTPHSCGDALVRFAGIGSTLVAALVASGLANLYFLAPPASWLGLVETPYGKLLASKLALVGAMLSFAALNRFILVPRLVAGPEGGTIGHAIGRLRLSIAAELAIGMAILLVVSYLGVLDPNTT